MGAGRDGASGSPEEESTPGPRAVPTRWGWQGLSRRWMPTALGRMCPWLRPALPLSDRTFHGGPRAPGCLLEISPLFLKADPGSLPTTP